MQSLACRLVYSDGTDVVYWAGRATTHGDIDETNEVTLPAFDRACSMCGNGLESMETVRGSSCRNIFSSVDQLDG
jgi:hypothetical protein